MKERIWRKPLGQAVFLLMVGLVWMTYSFLFMIFIVVDFEPFFVLSLMPVPLIMLIPYFHLKRKWGEAWHSPGRTVHEPSYEVIPRLESVLVEEEVSFTKRSDTHDDEGSSSETAWDEVYDLSDSELRLHIYAGHGRTTIFVGPLRKDNRAEVEELKRVVDNALD